MTTRFWRGPYAALEGRFLGELTAARRPLVLAPSRLLLRRLQERAAREVAVLWDVPFLTLEALASRIAEDEPADDDLAIRAAILDALRAGGFPSLRGTLESPAGARALFGSLRDLFDAGIDPDLPIDDVLAVLLEGSPLDRDEAERARDVLRLYPVLARRVRPASAVLRAAAARAAESPYLASFDPILIYGYYDFTQAQLDLIEAVVAARPAAVFVPALERHRFLERPFGYIESLAAARGGEIRPAGDAPAGAAGALVASLVDPEAGRIAAPGVRLRSAAGPEEEVWACAKEIQRLGLPLSEIAVVVRALDPYRDLIGHVFRAQSIPFVMSGGRPLCDGPAVQAARLLFGTARRGLARGDVVDLISSPLFVRPIEPGIADLLTRWTGVGASWEERLGPWTRGDLIQRIGRHEDEDTVEFRIPAATTREVLDRVRELAGAFDATPERASWSEWAVMHRAWLGQFLRGPLGAVETALDGLARLDRVSAAVDRDTFHEFLVDALDHLEAPPDTDANRGVMVLDAMAARGRSFAAIFVLGLHGRSWPPLVAEDPFLSDTVRLRIEYRLGGKLATRQDREAEEELLFAWALSAARERLVLSYPRADEEGRQQAPSCFFVAAASRLGAEIEGVPKALRDRIASPAGFPLSPAERRIAAALSGPPRGEIERAERLTPRDGLVEAAREMVARLVRGGISPTALEAAGRCPFQFYARNVLKLFALDEVEDEATPRDLGMIYDRALGAHYEERLPVAESVDRALGEFERERGMGRPAAREAMRLRAVRNLEHFLAFDRAWSRGGESRMQARVEGELSGIEGARFVGRIDRWEPGRVVDYKLRGTSFEKGLAALAARGEKLQAPVYFWLAKEVDEVAFLFVEGAAELNVEDLPRLSPAGEARVRQRLTREAMEGDAGARARAAIRLLLDTVGAGRFFVRPATGMFGHCTWCSFSGACRRRHGPTRRRSERDPAAAEYLALVRGKP